MNDKKLIEKWLAEKNLSLTGDQISALLEHIDLIKASSGRMNLVSKNDLPKLVERHLLDSLLVLTVYKFPPGATVADLGSGAGFPGVPVAIARPDLKIDLIESRQRKSLFLKKVVEKLKLINVQVVNKRWERIDKPYDIVLVRAVFNKEDLQKKVIPHLSPGGVLLHFAKYNNINVLKK